MWESCGARGIDGRLLGSPADLLRPLEGDSAHPASTAQYIAKLVLYGLPDLPHSKELDFIRI